MHQTSCQQNPRFPDAQIPDLTSPGSLSSITKIKGGEQSLRSTAPDLPRYFAVRETKVHEHFVTKISDQPQRGSLHALLAANLKHF
jgi:hypothetical protein